MIIYFDKQDRFQLSSTSKGNQIKWFKNNMYIKADTMGYEGFAEALASELLCHVVSEYNHIDYYVCDIIERRVEGVKKYIGCYSENCLKKSQSLVSVYRLLQMRYKDLESQLKLYKGKELVDWVVKELGYITGINCRDYLGFICKLDALTLNEDRHLNNISLVYEENTGFKFAPIFDNGLSFLSDMDDYDLSVGLQKNIRSVKSKPFSTDFLKQCSYFGDEKIKIRYSSLVDSIQKNKIAFIGNPYYTRAISVLYNRLRSTEGKIWERIEI